MSLRPIPASADCPAATPPSTPFTQQLSTSRPADAPAAAIASNGQFVVAYTEVKPVGTPRVQTDAQFVQFTADGTACLSGPLSTLGTCASTPPETVSMGVSVAIAPGTTNVGAS